MKSISLITFLAGVMALVSPPESPARDSVRVRIARLAEKDTLTVLVTDSGLGGISVCADIESRARQTGMYSQLRIIFANALPESSQGYNKMKSTAEKVRVFDAALHGMARWYKPDVILVACNTLSVLIPQTTFVDTTSVPVLGIVETGVEMLFERLSADPNSSAVIFATETTIGAGTHRKLLIEKGIDSMRLVPQACPDLAGEIEMDAGSDLVSSSIGAFVGDATLRLRTGTANVLAGLCCTHYGYVAKTFEGALRECGIEGVEIVDPNSRMGDILFPPGKLRRSEKPDIHVAVVSRAIIVPAEISSISTLVESLSPATAAALRTYTVQRDLFMYGTTGRPE